MYTGELFKYAIGRCCKVSLLVVGADPLLYVRFAQAVFLLCTMGRMDRVMKSYPQKDSSHGGLSCVRGYGFASASSSF